MEEAGRKETLADKTLALPLFPLFGSRTIFLHAYNADISVTADRSVICQTEDWASEIPRVHFTESSAQVSNQLGPLKTSFPFFAVQSGKIRCHIVIHCFTQERIFYQKTTWTLHSQYKNTRIFFNFRPYANQIVYNRLEFFCMFLWGLFKFLCAMVNGQIYQSSSCSPTKDCTVSESRYNILRNLKIFSDLVDCIPYNVIYFII